MVALAILGVFAIAVRIQNNMLLLMAVSLFVIFTWLLWAGQNIRGLRLAVRHDGQIIAGETAMLSVRLAAARPVYDIRVDSGGRLQGQGPRSTIFSAIRPSGVDGIRCRWCGSRQPFPSDWRGPGPGSARPKSWWHRCRIMARRWRC